MPSPSRLAVGYNEGLTRTRHPSNDDVVTFWERRDPMVRIYARILRQPLV